MFTEGIEAIQELARYVLRVETSAARIGASAIPGEAPDVAAARAARLIALKTQFARSVEMRLLPQGRAFPARAVWRAMYSLGLDWGAHDLFPLVWRNRYFPVHDQRIGVSHRFSARTRRRRRGRSGPGACL